MIIVPMILDSARTGQKSSLGSITITNDGTGTERLGNYTVRQHDKSGKRVVREAKLTRWPRLSKSSIAMLAAALKALGHSG